MAKSWAFAVMVCCTFLTSIAQFFFKKGAVSLSWANASSILNLYLLLGVLLYFSGAVLMILALRGGELSVLYPVIATSYIWVSLLSLVFLHEQMNFFKWSGICFVLAGVTLVGFGSRGKK
jgi:drug/metabolite transporter (DMT)-like permease